MELGKLEKIVDLRKVWPIEINFSDWLSEDENLALLSDAIGVDLRMPERESHVGMFRADILAQEEGTDRKVIIENQLEITNHDHLGQILTYVSGTGAEIAVWIVKENRIEHRMAIEWLNKHTDSGIGFFLVKIELWKIKDSVPAPHFNVLERPIDWAKNMISDSPGKISNTKMQQLQFWQAFNDYASSREEFTGSFQTKEAQPRSYYDIKHIDLKDCFISMSMDTTKKLLFAGLYFRNGKTKDAYGKFCEKKTEIGDALQPFELQFSEADKDCRIYIQKEDFDISQDNKWDSMFGWLIENDLKFLNIARGIK